MQGKTLLKKSTINHKEDELTEVNTEMSTYESCVNCCGGFWGFWRAWCPCICCCFPYPYRIVAQGSVGLLQRFGKYQRSLGPGMHKINACTEQVLITNLRTFTVQLQKQIILTRDNLTCEIDAVLYYRVVDPVQARYRLGELGLQVTQMTYSVLRTVCGEHTLQEMLTDRLTIASEIEESIFTMVEAFGVYVENIYIKDVVLSKEIAEGLSMAARTKKLAESKIISAKSDVETASLLRQAADTADSKAAMQIRYFESVQGIAKSGSQKVLFLPLNTKDKK